MSNYDLAKLKFLVVDDNQHMRTLVKQILFAFGCKDIAESADGAEALGELRMFVPDIVIVDWIMHPINGLEFVSMVRNAKDSANPYVPIIMLTGHTEREKVAEARDTGATEFLAKPLSARRLYERIINIVENPRPFIRTKTYFGPDRRRHKNFDYRGTDRRQKDANVIEVSPIGQAMVQ